MTIYGPDISNYQGSTFNIAGLKGEGFDFVIAKVSEGDYYADPVWVGYRDAARAAGLIIVGYHYVVDVAKSPADKQAALLVQTMGDNTIPVMLDFENNSGDLSSYWAVKQAIEALGVRVALSYIPHWYWQNIGSPDLSAVPGLIESAYVGGTGYASVLYPGDADPSWGAYGNKAPDLLQFTNQAQIVGAVVDCNAYRGTADQLRALLGAPAAPAPAPAAAPAPAPAPAPPPAPAAAPAPAGTTVVGTYTVQAGDNLTAIAKNYPQAWVTPDSIAALNSIDPNIIYPGQVLQIGGNASGGGALRTYTVQAGDNLTAIAKNYPEADVTADSIAALNSIDPNIIYPGQVLQIPN